MVRVAGGVTVFMSNCWVFRIVVAAVRFGALSSLCEFCGRTVFNNRLSSYVIGVSERNNTCNFFTTGH